MYGLVLMEERSSSSVKSQSKEICTFNWLCKSYRVEFWTQAISPPLSTSRLAVDNISKWQLKPDMLLYLIDGIP
jgi:hypothetical protein